MKEAPFLYLQPVRLLSIILHPESEKIFTVRSVTNPGYKCLFVLGAH